MILNCGIAIAMAVPRRPLSRPMCCVSAINSEQLRSQLDQLHLEAETTRAKANNARSRLLRLSEAAEKLQKQAAVIVQKGNENDAREMLFQRKKVLRALEKSKSRIELLDELSTKLNEAISLKESQLLGHVSANIEDNTDENSSPVRIVAPKEEVREDFTEDDFDTDAMKFSDTQDDIGSQGNPLDEYNAQESLSTNSWNEDNAGRGLREMPSFDSFMENIDQQLSEIEAELVTVLKISTMVLDNEEKPKNSKVQRTMELLESIHGIRERIRSTKEEKVGIF
ncbi:hypothetical protein L6164_029327 [Bauhinia variegata]|uniref:Uncharacterized protein n=1 Tax=Bauhinia variegata TaxID=167791 RepID=A0ACB9L961_BAUVA|nr:hypothetical protein L6164_029327 [Bauhinia variegata]